MSKRPPEEDEVGFENLAAPDEVHPSIRDLKLFYFKPETVPENFSGILFGQRRTGKTTWLIWFLWCMQEKFDHVVCFSATNFTGTYSRHMNPKLCYNTYDEGVLAQVLRIQTTEARKRVLIILDDVLDQEDLLRKSQALKTLFTMGRHYGISVVVCTQYPKCLPPSWRRNVDFAVLFYAFSRENADIFYKEYGMMLSKNQFFDIMRSACKDHRALIVRPCTQSDNIRQVYQLTKAQPHRDFFIGEKPGEKKQKSMFEGTPDFLPE
jgi:hypothetical protein